MSVMCKLGGSCSTKSGMCGHEKLMLGMMALVAVVGLAIWLA